MYIMQFPEEASVVPMLTSKKRRKIEGIWRRKTVGPQHISRGPNEVSMDDLVMQLTTTVINELDCFSQFANIPFFLFQRFWTS